MMDKLRAWLKVRRKRRLRILAVMLGVCMLVTTCPDLLMTSSVSAAEKITDAGVMILAEDAAHAHNDITFTAWTENASLPASGSYYLEKDVTLKTAVEINGTLNLCLNGHGITGGASNGVFSVYGGILNLYNCSERGTVSCQNQSSNAGCPINVSRGGTLNLYGGTVRSVPLVPIVIGTNDSDTSSNCVMNVYGGKVDAGTAPILVREGLQNPSVNIYGGTFSGNMGIAIDSGNIMIAGGTMGSVRARYSATVTIAGDAVVRGKITAANSIIASGIGQSGLSNTYKIDDTGLTDGSVVVKDSVDTTHYQLSSSAYVLKAVGANLVAGNQYTVSYEKNGGMIENEDQYTSYFSGEGLTLPTPAKEGYKFGGWYDNEGCTGTAVTEISAATAGDKEYWAKWTDNVAPVIGTLTYNYQPKNFWHWLIGKDSLIITVPVTDEGSGADEITYTVTPDGGTAKVETAMIQNGEAKIPVSADFKGTVSIVCTDKAGNTSAGVTVGAGLDANGIIIEDDAPQIAFQAENAELLPSGEYKAVPDIAVTVVDDKNNAVSGGIASVSYRINGGSAKTVPHDYTTSMVVHDSFTIPASGIPDGETVISVTAADHAGNSITETYTVKVLSKVKAAREAVEKALAGIAATNGTTKESIQSAIDTALSSAGITDVTVTVGDLTITEATTSAAGNISGSITISCGSENESISIEKTIAKLTTGADSGSGDSGNSGSSGSGSGGSGDSGGSGSGSGGSSDSGSSGSGESANQPPKEAGTLSKDVEKNENAPDTRLPGSEKDLADIILTEEEKAKVENGTDIRLVLDVKDAPDIADSGDKAVVEKTLSENTSVQGYDVGQYLDISLYKVIGTERSAISETSKKLTVVIAVPDSLKSKDSGQPRTFAVIRVHDGVAEVLKDLDDDADTITIETDRFSAYAIVYKEESKDAGSNTVKEASAKEKREIELHSGLKTVQSKKALQITWGSVSGADGYNVYAQYCGKKFDAGSLNQVTGGKKTKITVKKINGKKVDTAKKIKVYVVAWQWKNGKKTALAKTLTMHIAGEDDAKYTNVKSIQAGKTSYTLNAGGTVTLYPKAVLYEKQKKQLSDKHAKEFRYLSSNKNVATVTSGGKVKAKGSGSCVIYMIARNGCCKKIRIQVKE